MSVITRHDNTCTVTQVSSKREMEAEVMQCNEGPNLTVVMNKSVKLLMNWNGSKYEGRMAGMDFESAGPKISKTSTNLRGR